MLFSKIPYAMYALWTKCFPMQFQGNLIINIIWLKSALERKLDLNAD